MEGHERTGPWSPRSNEPVVMLKLFVGGVDALQLGHDVLGSGGPGLKKTLEKRRIHRSLTGQMLTPASWWYPSNGQTVVTVPHFQVGRVVTSVFFLKSSKTSITIEKPTIWIQLSRGISYYYNIQKYQACVDFPSNHVEFWVFFLYPLRICFRALSWTKILRWVFSFAGCSDLRCQQFIHLSLSGILQNWWFSKFSKGILPQISFRFRGLEITVICQDRWDVVEDFLIAELDWTVE